MPLTTIDDSAIIGNFRRAPDRLQSLQQSPYFPGNLFVGCLSRIIGVISLGTMTTFHSA